MELSSHEMLIGQLVAETKNINRRLDGIDESIRAFSQDRWMARGILVFLTSGATLVITKASVILAFLK